MTTGHDSMLAYYRDNPYRLYNLNHREERYARTSTLENAKQWIENHGYTFAYADGFYVYFTEEKGN